MAKQKIELVRSSSWMTDNFEKVHEILDETIDEFISESDKILNIQVHLADSGLSRFWIFKEVK